MQVSNILRAKFRRSLAELTPVLKRKLTQYQFDQLIITLELAQEGVLDSLEEILAGKDPIDFYEDILESNFEDILDSYDDAA
jgi:hypothetical protein